MQAETAAVLSRELVAWKVAVGRWIDVVVDAGELAGPARYRPVRRLSSVVRRPSWSSNSSSSSSSSSQHALIRSQSSEPHRPHYARG